MKKKLTKKKTKKSNYVTLGFIPLNIEEHPDVISRFPQGIELLHSSPSACFYGPLVSDESKNQYKGLAAIKALDGDNFEGTFYFL